MIQDNKVEIHIKNELADPKYELLIDGNVLDDVTVGGYYKEAFGLPKYYLIAKKIDSLNQIAMLKLKDFGLARVESIKLINWARWEGFEISVSFNQNNETRKETTFEVDFEPDLGNWKFPYSYNDYYRIFSQIWVSNVRATKYERLKVGGIRDKFMPTVIAVLNGLPIGKEIEENLRQFFETHQKVLLQLKDEQFENSLLALFSFPEEIKVSCKQYLEYFAAFLKDLGIHTTSNLKEEAGKVLFSITPTDDVEALDKIREALAIYLSLPSNPIPNSTGDRMVDMVLSGARANARHLESQLELAIAKLQFKEATLELKDATIEQHQLALRQKDETINELQEIVARGNIFEESLERVEINGEVVDESSLYRFSRADDIEVEATLILDEKTEETRVGLVKFHEVTKLKDYGVSFDLAKAVRDLIDYFKRNKSE